MATENKLDYQGKSMFYRIYGQGRPVMLVHGFGETGDVWKNQVAYLQDRFLLIVPDLPGSGQSDMVSDMTMDGMAEVLKAILEKENVATSSGVAMIGHSMGGYITLAFAEKYPSVLSCFGLFHSTAYADTEEKKATRRKGIDFIKQHGAFAFLKNTIPNMFSATTKERSPELVERFIDSLKDFSADTLIVYYESMIGRPDRTEVLKRAKVPVLFVAGESDNAIPLQDILKQTHLPEHSDIHVLKESGHMGMVEEREKSNQLLEDFLAENAGSEVSKTPRSGSVKS